MATCAESGKVGLKLIDLGNCFSLAGTDTSRISFEMQSLPFRAPEVRGVPHVDPDCRMCCISIPYKDAQGGSTFLACT